MDIGQIIKQRREELGMSQEELAQKAGYKSRSSINKIEVDGRGLPQSKITAIAKALRTTPASLMGWDETDNSSIGESAKEMLNNFQKLNDYGQKEALKRVSEMVHIPQYSQSRLCCTTNKARSTVLFTACCRS